MIRVFNSDKKLLRLQNRIKILNTFNFDFNNPKNMGEIQEKTGFAYGTIKTHLSELWCLGIINRNLFSQYGNKKHKEISVYYLNKELSKADLLKAITIMVENIITTGLALDSPEIQN